MPRLDISRTVAPIFGLDISDGHCLPLLGCKVQAGFPSPAEDWLEDSIDLNHYLVNNKAATFLVRVAGDSMRDAGIFHNDVLVVDRSVTARNGSIVVAVVDGEMTVKKLTRRGNKILLLSKNPEYPNIEVKDEQDFMVWGVVVSVIRRL